MNDALCVEMHWSVNKLIELCFRGLVEKIANTLT